MAWPNEVSGDRGRGQDLVIDTSGLLTLQTNSAFLLKIGGVKIINDAS